jgi:hypothetical protein
VALLVAQHLHAVFHASQQQVRRAQALRAGRGQRAELLARGQRRQQPALAQRRLAAAADQLQQLHDEFDFADAAGTELQVRGQILARDLGVDQRLHLAQAGERGVVEIAAVDERPQRLDQAFAGDKIAGDRPRLDPGVALPVAALALVVLLHRGEAQRDAPGAAERAQAQVDAEHVAVGGDFGEQLDQLLRDAGEERLVRERTRAVGLAVLGEREHQVDVGGKVQLAAAELAEREHDQALRLTRGRTRRPVACLQLALGVRERQLEAAFGQRGCAGERLLDGVEPVHVAPDQPQRLAPAEVAQHAHRRGFVEARRPRRRTRIGRPRIAHQRDQRRTEQRRIAAEALVGEIAGEQHALQVLGDAGVVVQRDVRFAAARNQVGIAGADESAEIGGGRGRGREHGGIGER